MQQTDGRDTRWEEHRIERRRSLVESTLRAIRAHGAGVTIDEIAAGAGTSKTVLYRYFGDRTGLYRGVVDRVSENILAEVRPGLADIGGRGIVNVLRDLTDAYTRLVERDPEIYAFVVNRPASGLFPGEDPVTGITDRIASELSASMTAQRTLLGREVSEIETLAHGVVGFIRSATGHWIAQAEKPRDRHALVDLIVTTFGPSIAGLSHEPTLTHA